MPSLAGQKLDKYDVLEEVGHGGMAVVYRGRDCVLDREVAVKVLHAHLADREESRRRLQREAKTVAKLRHDNIVEIFDSSDPEKLGDTYIICEFIHGVTLREWLDQRRKTRPLLAAMIAHRLCLPLEHAHSLGIVHRDIKPENVMIRDDGCLKLMDFGIAQILDNQRLTTTGQLLGSPAYMAPELISGKPVDKRIDIFALGVMLYQLATGELPFAGRNPAQVLNRILEGDYRPPAQIEPRIDEDLAAIIAKALALKPADRYQSARSMAADIEGYLAFHELEARSEELAGYFAKPDEWEAGLDARVCRVLTRKATKAMRDGHGARALKLLGRVLEIDPKDGRAKAMLDKVRLRGQRMRQVALAGGCLALIGSIAAGVVLTREPPPESKQLATSDPTERTTEVEAYVPYVEEPEAPAETGQVAIGTETGETETETGEPEGETHEPTTSGQDRPRSAVRCTLRVEGLPAATLAGGTYGLYLPSKGVQDLPSSGELVVELSQETDVVLRGESYGGHMRVDPEDCPAKVAILHAEVKPAVLRFQTGKIPMEDLVVTCESGCTAAANTVGATRFPKLPFAKGKTEMEITLTFQAKHYRKSEGNRYRLNPGENTIEVELEKAE
ncbi:serine/threonine-protein kinase [Nannocystaceae bacterium ST9]